MDSNIFQRTFLVEDRRSLGGGSELGIALAVFGKHPGWDDHIEDLGLETASLVTAKQLLYVEGLGGQIDRGAWESLPEAHRLPSFHHLFVWLRSSQFLLGRLWSSTDGKGRSRYPMVVCCHCSEVSFPWAICEVFPQLARFEANCKAAPSADAVRQNVAELRQTLQNLLRKPPLCSHSARRLSDDDAELLSRLHLSAGSHGLPRVLYQLQNEVPGYRAGDLFARGDSGEFRPRQMRIPASPEEPEKSLAFWRRFFLSQLHTDLPLLLVLPIGKGWMDVTVGRPGSEEFYSMMASPQAIPLSTEVPYRFDSEFQDRAARCVDAFLNGPSALSPDPPDQNGDASGGTTSLLRRFFKTLKIR